MRPPRYALAVTIRIYWGSVSFEARVRNLSERGLFVETSLPLWIGATFAADLMLQPRLRMTCSVARIEPRQGMGVEVSFLEPESAQRYAGLVGDLARHMAETR